MEAQIPTNTSPKTLLPPILALPLELKQQIPFYLCGDDNECSNVTKMILRRTYPDLRNVIPSDYHFVSKLGFTKAWQMFFAEREHPYLISPNYYPCYQCYKLLGISLHSIGSATAKGISPIGALEAHFCLCDKCWNVMEDRHLLYACHGEKHAVTNGAKQETRSRSSINDSIKFFKHLHEFQHMSS